MSARKDCRCCDGTGTVASIEGELRPCSRCNGKAFDRWAMLRRPAPAPFFLRPDNLKPRDRA